MSVAVTTIPTGVRLSAGMTCPRCGAPMLLVSSSEPMTREWKAVMRCGGCRSEQLLLVRLVEIADHYDGGHSGEPAVCGTDSGYQRHRKRKEPVCPECRAGHAAAAREHAARRRQQQAA